MRKTLLLAAAAIAAVATPAAARDGSGYIGIEGGLLAPRDLNGDVDIDFTAGGLTDIASDDAFEVDFKRGRDLDIIGGYDFGLFRLEGEVAWKRASLDNIEFDDTFAADLEDAGFDDEDFELDGRVKVRSFMANALFDFGADNGVSGFVGAGAGRARTRLAGDVDKSWAFQLLAGVRTAVTDNIDLGLKYRYFRTGRLNFGASEAFSGDIDGDGDVDTGVATVGSGGRFRSHSLLASLVFNFGSPAAALPPAPPPPPPAPVETAPATQTCPDGSVILATSVCPPPPPPPPPPPVERGERGQ